MHQTPEKMHTQKDGVPRLIGIGSYEASRGRSFPLHDHDCWELVYYRRGHIEVPVGEQLL